MLPFFARTLTRREMALGCAVLSLALLLSTLPAALRWGQAQLDTGALLCADTLRAGRYLALRIDLGGNARHGKNWWCVLYPGLCRSACGTYALPEENDLVCGSYVVRFKCVEWWQRMTASREDKVLVTGR